MCISSHWTRGTPWRIGSAFSMRLRMAGAPVPFHVEVTEMNAPISVAWTSTLLSVTGHRRFTFVPVGEDSTRVIDTKTFTSPVLPLRLFYPRPIIRQMSRRWLASLSAAAARMETT